MSKDKVSLTEYWDMLNSHDWYYDFSDDHSVWKAGVANRDKLNTIARQSDDHKKLRDDFSKHYFSGEPWGTERAPKPPRPS
jgi:hypothetical protein